jgi:hypothetical protein
MQTIRSYQLGQVAQQTLQLPIGARPLYVAFEGSQLTLWALVSLDASKCDTDVFIYATNDVFEYRAMQYIGSVRVTTEKLYHVFVEKK